MADQIVVSEHMLGSLKATRPWVMFLSILGFVLAALAALVGLIMGLAFAALPARPGMPTFLGPVLGGFYILLAIFFYLIPCLYLLRYANAISSIQAEGQKALEEALKQQKSFWKYLGIFAIVMIVVYIAFFIGIFVFIGHMAAHLPPPAPTT